MDEIVSTAMAWSDQGRDCALATVISTWGSSPRPVGSQLLVDSGGNFTGSVSGGCVESAVVREARDAITGRSGKVLEFGVSDDEAWQVGLACGGTIRILLTPCPQRSVFDTVARAYAQQQTALVVTSLRDCTNQVAVTAPNQFEGPLRDACVRAIRSDKSLTVEVDDSQFFVKVYSLPLRLLVIGAVHIGQALIPMARAAGYQVVLIDPRRAFAAPERFPDVEISHDWPDAAVQRLRPDRRTAVVALTHDSKLDEPALQTALASSAFYVGALGSRRTHAARCRRLRDRGVSDSAIDRIHAPIGLPIKAATPAEIAIAVVAEITAVLRATGEQ